MKSHVYCVFFPTGYQWIIYVLLSCTSISTLPLLLVTENYSRSNIDRGFGQSPYQAI